MMSVADSTYWLLTSVAPWVIAWAGYEPFSGENSGALPLVLLIVSIAALVAGVVGLVALSSRRHWPAPPKQPLRRWDGPESLHGSVIKSTLPVT
ncbi:hypothetical protein OG271_21035 [Micromonospora rifamycinica]|uniref:hypothetical protein n=1 Tax=Micromonospora rifamycinica TaxID=291594 RepID=UPI002E2BFA9E|nr:hypothetical protein [Micromonospora rifamycinica]